MTDPTAMKKKLPFKPTALRHARPKPTPSSSTEDEALQASAAVGADNNNHSDDDDQQDTLALFRRAKEMAPTLEADRERRRRRQLQRQQEQQEAERRRVSASSKHTLAAEGEDGEAPVTTPTPTPTQTEEDTIMATQEEDNRELVTPPPSKRSRRDTSGSSARHKDVDLDNLHGSLSAPDSPTARAMRSLGPDRSMTPALYNAPLYSGITSSSSAVSTSTYNTRAQARRGPPPGTQVIALDSDSESELKPAVATAAPVEIVDQALTLDLDLNADAPSDDDEFAEYVRKAQEQRDQHMLQKEQEAVAALSTDLPSSASAGAAAGTTRPIIDIVITSEVPGTRVCLIKFRFDRSLRLVRDSWTALQHRHGISLPGLDRDDDVILTWRRKKVYMVSTLFSLGIRLLTEDDDSGGGGDGTGPIVDDGTGSGSREGFNESRTRVHMQAWTPPLFAQMERAAAEDERRRRALSEEAAANGTQGTVDGDGDEAAAAAAAEEAEAAKLRIILKSKDYEAVKLKVLPETTTETLVAAFRAQIGTVPEDADVGLWFDGMRLEEGATMADADIDDMDTIEVHVK